MFAAPTHRLIMIACTLLLAMTADACQRTPHCGSFAISPGSRRGYSSFEHPNDTATWSDCSDGQARTLRCTTAHLSNWKCLCSVNGQEKTQVRADARFPDDAAAAAEFANRLCGWQIK